ncbi:MAG: septal ring lytic transglycosylase RlpA family protein [Pseudomonadota bacterium]
MQVQLIESGSGLRPLKLLVVVGVTMALSACSSRSTHEANKPYRSVSAAKPMPKGGGRYKLGRPYVINGVRYVPREDPNYDREGLASWYGGKHHGRQTANGETFDVNRITAAHKTLPLPSLVRITNLRNGRYVIARVNDRGPFVSGRIIDVSRRAAQQLGFLHKGTVRVRVTYIGPAPL